MASEVGQSCIECKYVHVRTGTSKGTGTGTGTGKGGHRGVQQFISPPLPEQHQAGGVPPSLNFCNMKLEDSFDLTI